MLRLVCLMCTCVPFVCCRLRVCVCVVLFFVALCVVFLFVDRVCCFLCLFELLLSMVCAVGCKTYLDSLWLDLSLLALAA